MEHKKEAIKKVLGKAKGEKMEFAHTIRHRAPSLMREYKKERKMSIRHPEWFDRNGKYISQTSETEITKGMTGKHKL
jgi:hypothetical protein